MSNIAEIDKNLKVETQIDREGLVFKNALDAPFKLYGIYKYTGSQSAIVLKNGNDGVIVISSDTTENTKTLYEEILAKLN